MKKHSTEQESLEIAFEHDCELIKLKLWYVQRLLKEEGLDFETAACRRVGLSRMTVFWGQNPRSRGPQDSDGWSSLLGDLRQLFEAHADEATTAAIESEGLALIWPFVKPAVPLRLAEKVQWLAEACGCFQYEFRPFYAAPESEDHLTLHVRNAYQPESPFHHFSDLISSLQEVISRAEGERPDVTKVQCATWLNSFPPFARLYPPSWIDTAQPGSPGDHSGWWGQFMDRRGGFHSCNAREFRKTGQFPFIHLLCRCGTSELSDHLSVLAR